MKTSHLLAATALASFALPTAVLAQDQPATTTAQTQTAPQCDPSTANCPPATAAADQAVLDSQSAQAQVSNGVEAGDRTSGGDIVVTGSRIRQPNLSSPVPVTSLTAAELPTQGQASIGDALNDLPSLRSTFGAQNSGRFIGTAGLNTLDLRGLGTSRTLVLVNGRRHITSSAGDFLVDVQTIPSDLVERIDIVTGGESAVYGSDAVAGVVNFVLKKDFEGLKVNGQGGISGQGDRGVYSASITAGKNFAGGRGNIAINAEYVKSNPLYYRDREHYRDLGGFVANENTIGESPAGDGIPDSVFRNGPLRNSSITIGGEIGVVSSDGTTLAFDPSGKLVLTTPEQAFRQNNSGTVISNNPLTGATLHETGQLAVGADRYDANLLAHYDFSDAFKPFIEAKYVHLKVLQEGQPSFFQGQLSGFFGIPNIRCDNPYLTAQNRDVLTNTVSTCAEHQLVDTDGDGIPDTSVIVTDANGNRIFDGSRGVPVSRFNVDFGAREEVSKRDTFRIVVGAEGDFNDDWHYEISANYGHFKSTNIEKNDLQLFDINGNLAGFSNAIAAVRNSAGQIVCGINADADPSNDDPACAPLDIFGYGKPSQAALDYINTTSYLYSRASELDIMGYVSGDLSQLFELPGGPIGFSIGAEYRRETAFSEPDPLSGSGATFFNAFKKFDPPTFASKELFGEVNLPLLKDLPFAKELTISGAARYSDYNTSANHTFAWNINGIYAPVSDIKFRANYSKSVRVPTPNDLYSPASVNFGFVSDPCAQDNITQGSANRVKNCQALGVPTTVLAGSPCEDNNHPVGSPFLNCVADAQTIQYTSAGNPNLQAETGKSLTVGAIVQPRFLPGFSLTVDYFDIKVTNLIATLDAQTILNQCVDLSDINNQYCQLINPRTQFGLFQAPALLSAGINYAKQTSRGIDFDLAYQHRFDNGWTMRLRGIATYTLERNNYTDPTDPGRYDRQLSELGDPVFSSNVTAGLNLGPVDLQYTLRYIGGMDIFAYDATHSVQGRPPTNPDVANILRYPSTFYHAARIGFDATDDYEFYLGVDNIFDTKPPLGATGTGDGSAIYDDIGRFFYAGFHAKF